MEPAGRGDATGRRSPTATDRGARRAVPHACCCICPHSLRPPPTSDLEELNRHAGTKWHMRSLKFNQSGDSSFDLTRYASLPLVERYRCEMEVGPSFVRSIMTV